MAARCRRFRGSQGRPNGPATACYLLPSVVRTSPNPAYAPSGPPLVLEPVVGPPIANVTIDAGTPTVIGRASACQVILADESVSRRHARLHYTDGRWFIADMGSRHGTHVNAIRLDAEGAAPLATNDLVGIGPWTFRARIGEEAGASHITTEDHLADRERIERVHERELAAITQNRLTLLMKYAAEVAGVPDEAKLAKAIVAAAIEGTGYPRAAILRELGTQSHEYEVVCERGPSDAPPAGSKGSGGQAISFSTSLLRAARSGEIAILTADSPMQQGASVMSLGIRTAMCAPISVGGANSTFLYLDARQGESGGARGVMGGFGVGGSQGPTVHQDAAAFCQALAKMYGLAIGNIKRKELEDRQAQLERELNAAREAQQLIMPPEQGTLCGIEYAMRMKSGRYVAGDLFDVVELGPEAGEHAGRVAVFLGDVAGKGVGAAILMATAQTYLNATLRAHSDPAAAIAECNRYVCSHASRGRFISLWLGVLDPTTGDCWFVDAGHGHWLVVHAGTAGAPAEIKPIDAVGGLLMGVDRDYDYHAEHLKLNAGDRIVLFSDGVVEQPGPDGEMFGLDGAIEALRDSTSCATDVSLLFDSVIGHAQSDSLKDDTTVASITLVGARGG